MTTIGRTGEDLKIFKVEYLSNHWSDFPQILNLSIGDHTKNKKSIYILPPPPFQNKILKKLYIKGQRKLSTQEHKFY